MFLGGDVQDPEPEFGVGLEGESEDADLFVLDGVQSQGDFLHQAIRQLVIYVTGGYGSEL